MNLGNLLAKKDGTAITGHAVNFKFMTMGAGRVRNINEAEARLFPVDEADRAEAVEAAKAYVSRSTRIRTRRPTGSGCARTPTSPQRRRTASSSR